VEKCNVLVSMLEDLDENVARSLLWHVAERLHWEPAELLGLDVDELDG
jgi:hypothetical protein